jgi:hypothetical protein
MAWRRRRSAYYARNDSYSRSANAEAAEAAGRLPRTRAAARLGVSVKAFDAGCAAAGYRTTEWHHVGKYASPVDYYDTNELSESVEFWEGAAACYKAKAKQDEIRARVPDLLAARKAERRAAFVAKLERQRDCTHPVLRLSKLHNWEWLVSRATQDAGLPAYKAPTIPPGDFSRLTATLAAMHIERQEEDRRRAEEQRQREERAKLHDRTNEIAAIVTAVQPCNSPGRVFLPVESVEMLEVLSDRWQRSMAEAKVEALMAGVNGVAFHNLTRDKHGNGWVPVRYAIREGVSA